MDGGCWRRCSPLSPCIFPGNYYVIVVGASAGLFAILAVGLNLLMGYAGQISLGHAAFFGLGAYASAILTTRHGWNPWLALGAGLVVTGLIAYLIARPVLRLKGHYLAMATLGFGIIVHILLVQTGSLTGGPDGIGEIPPLSLFGWAIDTDGRWYGVIAATLLLVVLLALNLMDSRTGRALRALHGSEVAAGLMGIDTAAAKTSVFVLAALTAGLAGSLFAHQQAFVSPDSFNFFVSIELVTMVVLGGMASTYGAILGAADPDLPARVAGGVRGLRGLDLRRHPHADHDLPAPGHRRRAARISGNRGVASGAARARWARMLLEASGLTKSFGGVTAIADLDFGVPEGLVYAVIGPNGAGKTTLFNIISGIYRPDEGRLNFAGQDLIGRATHQIARLGMSRTFQNLQIFFNMSVLENVMVGCHARARTGLAGALLRLPRMRREEEEIRQWAREALDFCGLGGLKGRQASELPYGALKRLEIARALAARPRLLLMDEPAAGLNDTETLEMRGLIGRIRDRGITILLVEHNMGLVMRVSDRILVLDYGSRLAEGTPAEVRANPQVVAAYLGGEVHYAVE